MPETIFPKKKGLDGHTSSFLQILSFDHISRDTVVLVLENDAQSDVDSWSPRQRLVIG